jgi:hypothetical protein
MTIESDLGCEVRGMTVKGIFFIFVAHSVGEHSPANLPVPSVLDLAAAWTRCVWFGAEMVLRAGTFARVCLRGSGPLPVPIIGKIRVVKNQRLKKPLISHLFPPFPALPAFFEGGRGWGRTQPKKFVGPRSAARFAWVSVRKQRARKSGRVSGGRSREIARC